MKVKSGFMLREVAGQWVVVPLGDRVVQVNGILTLSSSGALLWKTLEKGAQTMDELCAVLLKEYEVDEETVREDVTAFLKQLQDKGLIE